MHAEEPRRRDSEAHPASRTGSGPPWDANDTPAGLLALLWQERAALLEDWRSSLAHLVDDEVSSADLSRMAARLDELSAALSHPLGRASGPLGFEASARRQRAWQAQLPEGHVTPALRELLGSFHRSLEHLALRHALLHRWHPQSVDDWEDLLRVEDWLTDDLWRHHAADERRSPRARADLAPRVRSLAPARPWVDAALPALWRVLTHDVRNPLAAILLHVEMVARAPGRPLPGAAGDSLLRAARRLEQMLEDVEALARASRALPGAKRASQQGVSLSTWAPCLRVSFQEQRALREHPLWLGGGPLGGASAGSAEPPGLPGEPSPVWRAIAELAALCARGLPAQAPIHAVAARAGDGVAIDVRAPADAPLEPLKPATPARVGALLAADPGGMRALRVWAACITLEAAGGVFAFSARGTWPRALSISLPGLGTD